MKWGFLEDGGRVRMSRRTDTVIKKPEEHTVRVRRKGSPPPPRLVLCRGRPGGAAVGGAETAQEAAGGAGVGTSEAPPIGDPCRPHRERAPLPVVRRGKAGAMEAPRPQAPAAQGAGGAIGGGEALWAYAVVVAAAGRGRGRRVLVGIEETVAETGGRRATRITKASTGKRGRVEAGGVAPVAAPAAQRGAEGPGDAAAGGVL